MAHTKFRVEVLTPEGEVFNDEVEMLSTFTADGSIGRFLHPITDKQITARPRQVFRHLLPGEIIRD